MGRAWLWRYEPQVYVFIVRSFFDEGPLFKGISPKNLLQEEDMDYEYDLDFINEVLFGEESENYETIYGEVVC